MRLIDELRAEHDLIERLAGSLRTFARQRARGEGAPEDGPRFLAFFRLCANSVVLPESESRLRRHGRAELPSREATLEEEEARALGEELLSLYPPVHEPDVLRGDGCVACPAFTRTCRGLEREWWNEWEWEEFEDHLPSG